MLPSSSPFTSTSRRDCTSFPRPSSASNRLASLRSNLPALRSSLVMMTLANGFLRLDQIG